MDVIDYLKYKMEINNIIKKTIDKIKGIRPSTRFVKNTFVEKMNIEKTDENIKIIQDFFGEIMKFTANNIVELINEELDLKENKDE